MTSAAESFLEHHAGLHDLQEARGTLEWDQQVMMPPKAVEQRGRQLAALAGVIHERLCDPRFGELIEEAAAGASPDDAWLAADLREARRARDRALKVPAALVTERAEACSLAQAAWEAARPANDFAAFRPHLERVVGLTAQMGRCLSSQPYQALLDEYEPGMTTDALEKLFAELRAGLAKLLAQVQASRAAESTALSGARGTFPLELQQRLCRQVVTEMGFDFEAGRLDLSAHPFTAGTLRDVRITNRYDDGNLSVAISGAMHEAGHGLYEQGLDPERYRRPAGGACSIGLHESQSRFWENVVGRSRPFWDHLLPTLRQLFSLSFGYTEAVELFRASNRVRPSLIRVDADELTYNLHIVLRYQLERALVEGQLAVADLPAAWREGMLRDVGVEPPDDRRGALQDVHWAAGLFGYFPTYTLGNLYAAQLGAALRRELPRLDELVARGELGAITGWLRRNVHARGALLTAPELCRAVTGRALEVTPFLDYLAAKLGQVYDF
jgi:carboxypeptidase Taq